MENFLNSIVFSIIFLRIRSFSCSVNSKTRVDKHREVQRHGHRFGLPANSLNYLYLIYHFIFGMHDQSDVVEKWYALRFLQVVCAPALTHNFVNFHVPGGLTPPLRFDMF